MNKVHREKLLDVTPLMWKILENKNNILENKNKIPSLGHENNILLQMIGSNLLSYEYFRK